MRIKKILTPVLDFFIYSNLLIAIASFLFTVQTALVFNYSASAASFFALTNFVCTFIMYNIQRIYQSTKPHNNTHLYWYDKHKRLLFTIMLLLVSVYAIVLKANYRVFQEGLLVYIPISILSLFYFIPPFTLRRLPFFKVFFIALVWVISSVFIPLLYNDITYTQLHNFSKNEIAYLISQFCFIAALCVPFDIRDVQNDQQHSIKTLPVQFGISKAKSIGFVLLVLYMVLVQDLQQGIVYAVCGLLGIILIIYSSQHKHRYYFSVLVDGLIIVQFALYVLLFAGN